mmetsp:Transcript_49463/g.125994  ORF Transcript_49463/g.125994 Transcript_49463/m.125994 type:complete len:380 (-) Transcript_49463:197-1336(-)
MKRRHDYDGDRDGPPPKKPGGKGGRNIDLPYVLKILAPEVLASAVIGRGGANIKALRESTGAKVAFTDHNEFFPGTESRVCTAQANTEEALNEVVAQIVARVSECVESSSSDDLGQPPDGLIFRTVLPRAAGGGLIGKGGATIKQLREQTGAKVSVSDPEMQGPGADQVVTITGSAQGIEQVMAEANKQVQLVNEEPWFQGWAASSGCHPSYSGEGGKGGKGSKGGRGGDEGSRGGRNGEWGDGSGGGGSWGGSYRGGRGGGGTGVNILLDVARGLPHHVMEDSRGFALSCVVPNRLVGGLIGRGGAGTQEVQGQTGTKIGIREIHGDPENRSLNIAGPLPNACAAYMLMMKRYLDSEQQALSGAPPPGTMVRGPPGRR